MTALTAIMIGPITAKAAGSSRHAGLRMPKTTSAAALVAPCMAVAFAAPRRLRSSATCTVAHAAP
eukprot:8981034-Lingulodinium_polyedra.AAC.1